MQDRRYLLSIEELLDDNAPELLWKQSRRWLDAERQSRVERTKSKRKQAENIGAGLLVQLAVMEAVAEKQVVAGKQAVTEKLTPEDIIYLTLSELLKRLEQSGQKPLPLEYTYGQKGKPYLKKYPYYFNLSHSGKYLFCVLSEQEVGADIQWRKPITEAKLAERFFSEEEKKELEASRSLQEMQHTFYRLWTGKEAYGKLTGEGLAAVIDRNIHGADNDGLLKGADGNSCGQVALEEYEIDDYQIAVCKWK